MSDFNKQTAGSGSLFPQGLFPSGLFPSGLFGGGSSQSGGGDNPTDSYGPNDHRIRLPGPRIDFQNDVGLTGQTHDDFPAPGQARFDHMRMYLIGLLSCQSGQHPPTQYRDGTLWFDQSGEIGVLRIRDREAWRSIAEVVEVAPGISLSDWYNSST